MKISGGLGKPLIDTCTMEWRYLYTEWWTSTEKFLVKERKKKNLFNVIHLWTFW